MELNVVILNWNACQDTIDCLSLFDGWTRIEPRLCVVDNGSEADDSQAIAAAYPQAIVVSSEENLGFAGGTNLGLRTVLRDSEAPILLLNNDVTLSEAAVETLMQTLAADDSYGVVGPVLYTADEPPRVLSAGSHSPVLYRNHSITLPPGNREIYPVEFVSGAAALIRASLLRQIGDLNESYFFGLELADFCRRAQQQGHLCVVTTAAKVKHDVQRSSVHRETLYVYYVIRNRLLYSRRFFRWTWPLLWLGWSLYGLQQALRLWFKQRRGTASAIAMGIGDGLRGRFGNQNERVLRVCATHPNSPFEATGPQKGRA